MKKRTNFLFKCCIKKSFKSFFALFLLLLLNISTQAKNFYFSSSTGNDSYTTAQAQSQATPWRSLSKLNSFFGSLLPGDVIYFKRGDIFYGSVTATRSGSAGLPITFDAYGSGSKPVISGFTTAGGWSSYGSNIHQSTVSAGQVPLNMVSINGVPQHIGRFPNYTATADPYLYYETISSNSSGGTITDNQLTSATNWTGADVVIRKKRWILDKAKITSHSGTNISYSQTNGYSGINGFGYFIQNDPRTLDQFGEWYFNPTSKNLLVHFGGNQPTNYSVKASVVNLLMNLDFQKYITVKNLSFEGANTTALTAKYGSDVTIQSCDFSQIGKDGLVITGSNNTLLENLTLSYILNNPISVYNTAGSVAVVRNCSVSNCSLLAGMGENGDGNYQAISVQVGSNAIVEYNNVNNVGYTAIDFQGNDIIIRNNVANNYCMVKDDGGGIYTAVSSTFPIKTYTNRKIYSNIITNAIGEPYGTTGKTAEAKGIYMDAASMNVEIYDNSIANIARTAILMNNSTNIKITGNTIYNARFGVEMVRLMKTNQVRNIDMRHNIIFPVQTNQNCIYYKNFYLATPTPLTLEQDMSQVGKFDSNYYATPSTIGFSYYTCQDYTANPSLTISPGFNLEGWRALINGDSKSKRPAKIPATASDVRFEYNSTTSIKTITLDANYMGVDGTQYNGSITLQPFTSKVLVKNGSIITTPLPAILSLKAAGSAPAISCFGSSTTATVSGSGGTLPYTGTGSFNINAGKGSLKISFPMSTAGVKTVVFAPIGSVTSGKKYVLRFSTLGTTSNGLIDVFLNQVNAPFGNVAGTYINKNFGATRTDHEYVFTATANEAVARFEIKIQQNSGTTYLDNIAFFETDSAGALISNNIITGGQFESNITAINVWSSNNNQLAELDLTSKISNTFYYTVRDSNGALSTVGVKTIQPALPLQATASAGIISILGGSTTVLINATGGTAPYTGTGSFLNIKKGTYNYTVTDAAGCSVVATINIFETLLARAASPATAAVIPDSTATAKTTTASSTTKLDSIAAKANIKTQPVSSLLKINTYPNPTTNYFTISVAGGSNEMLTIVVSGVDGRMVYSTTGTTNKVYTFGNNFMPGIYFVQVLQGQTKQSQKIIKIQ